MNQYEYLDKFVFKGLNNLNDGFDSELIKYFSKEDFQVVIERVEKLGLGIYGIEPWINGGIYGVVTFEERSDDPSDPSWYKQAFNEFIKDDEELQYAASYYIPGNLLT